MKCAILLVLALRLLTVACQQFTDCNRDSEPAVCVCDNDAECSFELRVDDTSLTDSNALHTDIQRRGIAVNNGFHGPTLIVNKDVLVKVEVENGLSEPTTVHWHGLHQKNTPWMDGVHGLSQPSIQAGGGSFDYIFRATQAGTHWYHSHQGDHRPRGLFGTLIVREEAGVFDGFVNRSLVPFLEGISNTVARRAREMVIDTPNLHTLTLLDWKDESSSTEQWFGLINGRENSNFTVAPNNIYRFRVIGAQHTSGHFLSIDDHKLYVISTDGNFFEPQAVDFLFVHSGERYDFIIETFNQVKTAFRICMKTLQNPTKRLHQAYAALYYGSGRDNVPDSPQDCSNRACDVLNCPFSAFPSDEMTNFQRTNCIQLDTLRAYDPPSNSRLPKFGADSDCVDCMHFFHFAFEDKRASTNGWHYIIPEEEPYQTNCDQNTRVTDCSPSSNACVYGKTIARDEQFNDSSTARTVIMVFSASGDSAHPIHLHGHDFHILKIEHDYLSAIECEGTGTPCRWQGNDYPTSVTNNARGEDGLINGDRIRKDTVVVPADGYVVIAYKANNPGYWFLHCHIEPHLTDGMAVFLEEYPPSQHRAAPDNLANMHDRTFRWTFDQYRNLYNSGRLCGQGTDNGDNDNEDDGSGNDAEGVQASLAGVSVLGLVILSHVM